MTASCSKIANIFKRSLPINIATTAIPWLVIVISIVASKSISMSVRNGMMLCFKVIIPSVFPFLILSDFMLFLSSKSNGALNIILSRILGVSPIGATTFICGNICGFPIGAKCASTLYSSNQITKNECQRLVEISTNPSVAFVIAGVGIGIFNNTILGITLYISTVISSIIIGVITKSNKSKNTKSHFINEQKFNLVASIKNAGMSCIAISSYIVFFSVIIELIRSTSINELFISFVSSFIEIGNSTKLIHEASINTFYKLLLLGFSMGFSGLSVHMQVSSFLPKDISMKRYLMIKLLQGIICASLSLLMYIILNDFY